MSGPGEVGTVHAGEDVVGAGDAGVGDGRQPAGGPRSPSGRCTAAHRVEHCVHAVRDQPEHLVGQALAVRDHHPAAGRQKLATAAPDHGAYVRHLVLDNLSSERLRGLGQDAERILQRIESPTR
jgi:hypothetical protein